MATTPIGEPIPVGDLSSSHSQPATTHDENPTATIDALRSDILSAESPSTIADEAQTALPAAGAAASEWADLVRMSWQIALMPAMTWSSYLSASWKAWENALQPQWPSR